MAFEDFARHLSAQASPVTVGGYVRDLQQFAVWFEHTNGETLEPERVTPSDVREYRNWLQRRGLRAATVNRRLAAVRAWLDWARHQGRISENPARRVPGLREQPPGLRWLDKRERYALRRAAERILQVARLRYPVRWVVYERDALLTLFLLNTGLRAGEVVRLRWSDVVLGERKGHLLVRGKGDKQRVVPLNKAARDALRRWKTTRRDADIEGDQVWAVRDGLTVRTVQRAVARVAREAGVEATPHVLRHTFAKSLVDAGVSLEKVARILGHKSLDTTRRYVEPSAQDLARAVEEVAL